LYVAGQTAPGDGIQIRKPDEQGHNVLNMRSGQDVVLRYLRVRSGRGEPGKGDNISFTGGRRIVVDHVSMQWSNDEQVGIHGLSGGSSLVGLTIQNSIMAQALRSHSTGLLISYDPATQPRVADISLHGNLFAHNGHRNPRVVRVKGVQVINNVIFNWHSRVGRTVRDAEVDYVGNYFKAGPWSGSNLIEHEFRTDPGPMDPSVYLAGNVASPTHMDPNADNRSLIRYNKDGPDGGYGPLPDSAFRLSPLPSAVIRVPVVAAAAAFENVLSGAGASARLTCEGTWQANRDAVDRSVVDDTRAGVGPDSDADMDHQDDYGGYPDLSPGAPCPDTDKDGMPDGFETLHGLDGSNPADRSGDPDRDGYTNIEEYVNGTKPS